MRSNFVTRFEATVLTYGGKEYYVDMSNKHCTPESILLSTVAKVLWNLGLINYEHQKKGVTDDFVRCSLSTWITCHSLFTTIKQSGFRMVVCYFADCSYIRMNEETLTAYYNDYKFYLPEEVAK
ncbi:hypothetical protein M3Y98_00067600 [Aphelenchoides besseyi]|nr:hypothetical protein M3Y98_00067600 [Aphelenchoides besseyi]